MEQEEEGEGEAVVVRGIWFTHESQVVRIRVLQGTLLLG